MTPVFRPRSTAEVGDAIREAVAARTRLALYGRNSKAGLGRPVAAGAQLDLSQLSGIELYEPEELVLAAAAATPLADIEAALRENRQQLAFEPPDLGPLLGRREVGPTLGGIVACNLSGPRRIRAGAARDHVLGIEGVSGRGDVFRSGGRVMKNVTGYDLSKLMAGSFGTLAALTCLTVKVMPAPEKTRTVLLFGLSDDAAIAAMSKALSAPYDVSGAVHLPAPLPASSQVARVAGEGEAVTALRLEGTGVSVEARCRSLRELLLPFAPQDELHTRNSVVFWREMRDVQPFVNQRDRVIWRIAVPPARGAETVARLRLTVRGEHFYDWGGGLVWLAVPTPDAGGPGDGAAGLVRAVVKGAGGHATLVAAPAVMRQAVPPFEPLEGALAALHRRLKDAFDPMHILNPGRMYAEL